MTDLQEAFYSAAAMLGIEAPIEAEWKKLAGLRAKAEYRQGKIIVKVSDGYAAGGRDVLVGLATSLLGRLFRRNVQTNAYIEAYKSFLRSKETNLLHRALKNERGRKRRLSAKGKFYDLAEMTAKLVSEYEILQTLPIPKVGWSKKSASRRIGFYDGDAHEVVMTKALDSKSVPFYVVEYVLMHELLHAKHEIIQHATKRTVHTRDFKKEERDYAFYREAEKWLKGNRLNTDD